MAHHGKQYKWVYQQPPHQRRQLPHGLQHSELNIGSSLAGPAFDLPLEGANCILEAFAGGKPDFAWGIIEREKALPAPRGANHCNRRDIRQQSCPSVFPSSLRVRSDSRGRSMFRGGMGATARTPIHL